MIRVSLDIRHARIILVSRCYLLKLRNFERILCQYRHITRRCVLVGIVHTVSVREMRRLKPDLVRLFVHHINKL